MKLGRQTIHFLHPIKSSLHCFIFLSKINKVIGKFTSFCRSHKICYKLWNVWGHVCYHQLSGMQVGLLLCMNQRMKINGLSMEQSCFAMFLAWLDLAKMVWQYKQKRESKQNNQQYERAKESVTRLACGRQHKFHTSHVIWFDSHNLWTCELSLYFNGVYHNCFYLISLEKAICLFRIC